MFFPSLGLIATTNVITVDIHENVQTALNRMHEHNHRSVIVVDGPQHYILTSKDIIRLRLEGIGFETPLFKVHLRPLPLISRESNIVNALNLTNEQDEHICVCNEDGSLYGLVTNSDIISSVDPQIVLDSLQIGTLLDKNTVTKVLPPIRRSSKYWSTSKTPRMTASSFRKTVFPSGFSPPRMFCA